MMERLGQVLARRQKVRLSDARRVPSAVLIPIYHKEGEYHILFTKRTETVRDHKGQISFPGGACEAKDRTPLDTALRECVEEIGLPPAAVEPLGELDDFATIGTNYIISPFVAAISWPFPLRVDPTEVAELLEVPLSALLDKKSVRQGADLLDGRPVPTYFYDYQGQVIWGATARILNQFLAIWSGLMKSQAEPNHT